MSNFCNHDLQSLEPQQNNTNIQHCEQNVQTKLHNLC